MKSLTLRAGLALLCAATLSACGGGSGSLVLQTTIVGLIKDGLIITNGGDTLTVPANTTGITFPTLIGADDQFDIEIKQQPTHANCVLANNKNKANVYTVVQSSITCTTDSYNLGGTVFGLTGTGLVIANGADRVSVTPSPNPGAPVAFIFPTKVPDGSPYGVTVLAQPTNGQVCEAYNNSGNMPSGDSSAVGVNCH